MKKPFIFCSLIKLPNKYELDSFNEIMCTLQQFPTNYIEDVIIKIPANNIMNKLQRAFLTLYSYDTNPDDISVHNVLNQSMSLISKAPILMVYSYHAKRHAFDNESLILHKPCPEYSIAENILHMIRLDCQFTQEEAKLLDLLMIVQVNMVVKQFYLCYACRFFNGDRYILSHCDCHWFA